MSHAPPPAPPVQNLIGDSPLMRAVLSRIRPIARTRRTTLIFGATGTGKEVVAKALHETGQPRGSAFVIVNCGTIPDTLADDELIAHTRGAFRRTRYTRDTLRAGAGGTLFLDEIDSLSPKVQAGVLHLLESDEFQTGGAQKPEHVTTWVIAATSDDLAARVRSGSFRADLLYRLQVMRLDLPPLRLRGLDVELLAYHFLNRAVGAGRSFTPRAIAALHRHEWPGNVRELKHCVERASLFTDKNAIDSEDLGLDADDPPASTPEQGAALEDDLWNLVAREGLSLAEAVSLCERAIIDAALRAENGNRTRAAERLRIHLRTIFKKLRAPA